MKPLTLSSPRTTSVGANFTGNSIRDFDTLLSKMAETAKKAKKKKGKTLVLAEFLAKDSENGSSSVNHAAVFSARSTSWADESETLSTEVDTSWPEESYGGTSASIKMRAAMDRASLPTAPRAARGPDVDTSKIPDGPPYTAFLGNLSYDVDKDDILEFFKNSKITEVRLPQDSNGRLKGFGYAEFEDKGALIAALTLNNEHLKNRRIRVDIAGHQQQDRERGERESRSNEPDRTDGDWRRPDASSDQNGFSDRERSYDDGPRSGYDHGPRDRPGFRGFDDGPPRDKERDRSGNRGYDDGPWDRSGNRGFDDGPPRDRHQGYDDGPRDRWGQRGYGDGPPRDRSGYRGFDDGPPRDRSGFGSGYGRDRGYDDGPRGDDRYGDRGNRYGSGWDYDDRDRQSGRGGYGRERFDNRRYSDRYGSDDRGGAFGRDRHGDRYGGDRDRGGAYSRDRYDDRPFGDRDRYDDYRGGDRYGDKDRRRDVDEQDWNAWRDGDRGRDGRRDYNEEMPEPVKERPKLQLQPRTKPVEEKKDEPVSGSSVFGGAKPVDTASKEREIEEKLARQKLEDEAKIKQEREKQRERREHEEWPRSSGGGRQRRDSNRSNDGDKVARERRDSSDYRSRRDSARSVDEGTHGKESEPSTRDGPRGTGKDTKEVPKETPKPAPPPAVNVWEKRMEQQKAASVADSEAKSPKAEEHRVEFNVDSATMTVSSPATSPDRKGFGKPSSAPRKEFSGPSRGRGRSGERSSANGPSQERGAGRGVKKERRERKPAEPRKYEEAPQPVFHTASKFSVLLDDEDVAEHDTEQFEAEEETP